MASSAPLIDVTSHAAVICWRKKLAIGEASIIRHAGLRFLQLEESNPLSVPGKRNLSIGIVARRSMSRLMVVAGAAIALTSTSLNVRSTMNVDLVLVLALDVSASVDRREFDLQKNGLAKAFRHRSVLEAIQRGQNKRIAVTAVQWSGYQDQFVSIPWQIVGDASSAAAFAEHLSNMPRRLPDGFTHIAGAIQFSMRLVRTAPFSSGRQVIDVSGDGSNNVHPPPQAARDAAVAAGITVNGLAIVGEAAGLDEYYRKNVIGGPGSFVIQALNYDDYDEAILRKLLREISFKFIL
ncbi:MAG: DUF1194 domain-containing protein [Hyphomicrobiaceae bacterium]